MGSPPPLAEPSGLDSCSKRLRFQVSRPYDPAEKDRIAAELRKILRIAAVKSIDHGRRDLKNTAAVAVTVTNCDKPSAVPVESRGSSGYLWIIIINILQD